MDNLRGYQQKAARVIYDFSIPMKRKQKYIYQQGWEELR